MDYSIWKWKKKNGRSHLSLGMLWLTVKSLISCSSFTSEFKAAGSTLDCIVGLWFVIHTQSMKQKASYSTLNVSRSRGDPNFRDTSGSYGVHLLGNRNWFNWCIESSSYQCRMIPCRVHCHSVGDPENHIFSSAMKDFFHLS